MSNDSIISKMGSALVETTGSRICSAKKLCLSLQRYLLALTVRIFSVAFSGRFVLVRLHLHLASPHI